MPFWDHVYELRNRLLGALGALVLFSIAGYYGFPWFVEILHGLIGEDLYATGLAEGFLARMKSGILFGALLSTPVFFSEITLFIFPALTRRQKNLLVGTSMVAFILFLAGAVFAFQAVLPFSIRFLKSDRFFPSNVNRLISYSAFIQFFFQFLLGFGMVFQFPVVLVVLMKLRVLGPQTLVKNIKVLVPLIFLLSAIMTPPDIVSQIMLATPMVVLYLGCILIGKLFHLG